MAATFVVEDGTGKSDANAFITIAEADQAIDNYWSSSTWTAASDAEKQDAIRKATQYMCLSYTWKGYRVHETQALQWPREWVWDDEGWYIEITEIPQKVKDACAYLALKVIEGATLLEDQENESEVKKTKFVVGPITEEIEYVRGEAPDTAYVIADNLLDPYTEQGTSYVSELERA
jgi:hypothetical protein